MRRKGILTLLITVFSVVAFAGMAFAAQNIFLKTTVPDIPKSTCYQAGTESLSLDNLTVLTNGDIFRFTLSNNVPLCRNINFYLRLHDGLLVADAALPASTAAEPVTSTNPAADVLNLGGGLQGTGRDFGLLVTGNAGSQVVTMQLASRTKATGVVVTTDAFTLTFIGGVPANQLIVKLFDEKFLTPYFWKDTPAAGTAYLADSAFAAPDNFTSVDNTLCINTISDLWLGEYVQFTANSIPNPVTGVAVAFSGDFFIAHMFAQARYQLSSCTKATIGNIRIGTSGGPQGVDVCAGFDFETAGGVAPNPYCDNHNGLNRVVIQAVDAPFTVTGTYTMRMEILVNGLTGDRGVYFQAGSAPQAIGATTSALACAAVPGAIGAASRFLASGAASGGAPADASCTIAAANRAVVLTTAASSMNIAAGQSFLNIDLPVLKYDLSKIVAGDVVTVRITLTRGACIGIGPVDVNVGTFGCSATTTTGSILFPYFTSLSADDFWNGIAIINTSSTATTATLTAYEKDGSLGTATVDVPANGMYVNLLESISWTGAGLGGSQCFIQVTAPGVPTINLDGFGMIAKETTGESMGYLPRK